MSYVLFPVEKASTSLEARQHVMNELSDDPTFVGEGGLFASPVCDWFVIGGRWSGKLYRKSLRDEFWNQAKQLQPTTDHDIGFSNSFIQENRKNLDTIWRKLGGQYASPLNRDPYSRLGEDDDACVLDDSLAKDLNVYLHNHDEYDVEECCITNCGWGLAPKVISLDYDLLCDLKDFTSVVGEYWVVVIDYHC